MASDERAPTAASARSPGPGAERWRIPLIASALVLAAGLVLEAWTGDAEGAAGGAALIVIGVAGALVSAVLAVRPAATTRASAARDIAGSAALLAVGVPAIVWAASGVLVSDRTVRSAPIPAASTPLASAAGGGVDESTPHTHAPGDTTHADDAETDAGTASDTATGSGSGTGGVAEAVAEAVRDPEFHEHGVAQPEQPLDPPTRTQLGGQLVTAREVALAYPTVADAEAAGYRKVTRYIPLIGAHYMRFTNLGDGFVTDAPEMLLFDGTEPDSRIVGLSYFVVGSQEPGGFAGPNDHWHQHKGLCLKGLLVVGGERVSEEECARRGGRKANDLNAWMVHAWVVPGWESPQGVFSPEHPGLV
jgi:hypothetical protein